MDFETGGGGCHEKYLVIAIKSKRFGISFWYYTHSFYIQKSCMVLHLGQFDWKLATLMTVFSLAAESGVSYSRHEASVRPLTFSRNRDKVWTLWYFILIFYTELLYTKTLLGIAFGPIWLKIGQIMAILDLENFAPRNRSKNWTPLYIAMKLQE